VKTVDITIFGHVVKCPDLPEYRKFYDRLRAGSWEPHTFAALRDHIDRQTVYVDIGGFTGVVAFWASHLAKHVIVVEPDPRCREILACVAPAYPNVTVLEGALSPLPTLRLNAVGRFGSSESSALDIGDGASLSVPGLSIDRIMQHAGSDPAFVKIDIEGYEYCIPREIARLARYPLRGVQCALHPALYERSLSGPRWWRRLRTAAVTVRLGRMFAGRLAGPRILGFSSFAAYLVSGVLLRGEPKGKTLFFLRGHPCGRARNGRIPYPSRG
jgi:FkbM family methyltransferase